MTSLLGIGISIIYADLMIQESSAVRRCHATVKPHLKNEKICVWQTDNGSDFRGVMIDRPGALIEELIEEKLFSVPN